MGRPSSSSSPFLIQRSDTKKYVYHRRLSASVQPIAIGAISIPWKAKILELEGPATIKVALSTGDLKLARERRDQIHVQIEDILARGRSRLYASHKARLATEVSHILAEDRHRMSGQVVHDILAADDQAQINRDWTTPLADLITDIRGAAGVVTRPTAALAAAQDVERRKARHDLTARNMALYDQRIEEGEIAHEGDLISRLQTIGKVLDPKGITLDIADVAILARRLEETSSIPSPVDVRMADNGISMPRSHPDRRLLALELLRAETAAYDIVLKRRVGDPTPTPERPERIVPPPSGATISQMRERWIELHSPGKKARDDNKLYVDAFIAQYGDCPVASVTRQMIRGFRDLLKQRPRNMPKDIAQLPLKDQVAWGKTVDCRLITAQTVNAKGIGSLSAIMEAAKKDDVIEANPCANQLLLVKGHALDRHPYDVDDLNKIFASAIYASDERWTGGGGAAQFWMPLIALFAGARLEEIGQLLPEDIRTRGNIAYFNFIEIDEDAEAMGAISQDKELKTQNGRREVPVHPFLIEIGILRYVAKMKSARERRLFPDLRAYEGKLTKNWSRWWGRYAREHVTQSRRKVFHSFRHAFADRIRNITGGNEDVVKALMGHSKHMYGRPVDLKTRSEIIARLDYPDVVFSIVRQAATRLWL